MEGAGPRSRELPSPSRLGGARRRAGTGNLKLAGAGGSRSRGCRGALFVFGMEEEPGLEVEGRQDLGPGRGAGDGETLAAAFHGSAADGATTGEGGGRAAAAG